jgi:hypothetical protein
MWAGRCLQLKGAKVVTGARQTGVKDRILRLLQNDFWRKKPHSIEAFCINLVSPSRSCEKPRKMMAPTFLLRQQASPNVNAVWRLL